MATANLPTAPPSQRTTHLRVVSHEQQRDGWHRIKEVRQQQGVSLRTASRRLGIDSRTVRAEEDSETDLPISRLYHWQEILDVPMVDLLTEPQAPLSRPVMERAKMVRIMKTAMSMRDSSAEDTPMGRMATMLVEQMIDLMPELEEISAWHTVGQRRSLDEVGRIAERPINCRAMLGNHGSVED